MHTRRDFIALAAISSLSFAIGGCKPSEEQHPGEDEYQSMQNSALSDMLDCFKGQERIPVNVIYLDKGSVDVQALSSEFDTQAISLASPTTYIDSLTTESAKSFFSSVGNDNSFISSFKIDNSGSTLLSTLEALMNDKGIIPPTVILITSTEYKTASRDEEMEEASELLSALRSHNVMAISSTNVGGAKISDYCCTCIDEVYAVTKCNYDGTPCSDTNVSDEKTSIDYSVPAESTYKAASKIAGISAQLLSYGFSIDDIEGALEETGYSVIDESKQGKRVVSLKELCS